MQPDQSPTNCLLLKCQEPRVCAHRSPKRESSPDTHERNISPLASQFTAQPRRNFSNETKLPLTGHKNKKSWFRHTNAQKEDKNQSKSPHFFQMPRQNSSQTTKLRQRPQLTDPRAPTDGSGVNFTKTQRDSVPMASSDISPGKTEEKNRARLLEEPKHTSPSVFFNDGKSSSSDEKSTAPAGKREKKTRQ